jgi:polyferredoxin
MKRRIVQLFSLIVTNSYFTSIPTASFYQGTMKGVCVPILNCYACPLAWGSCPIGTLQHFIIVRALPFYLIGILGAIGLGVGRWACGWLCPFGWLQEFIYKLKVPKFSAPDWLRHMKYVILVLVVGVVTWVTFEPWFCKFCPAGTLEAGLPWLVWAARGSDYAEGMSFATQVFALKIVMLVVLVALAAMMRRPFCRFVCPLGAIFGLMNKFSLLQLDFDLDTCAIARAQGSDIANCAVCQHCSKDCPMGLKVPEQIGSVDCIRCMNCTTSGSVFWRFGIAPSRDRTGEKIPEPAPHWGTGRMPLTPG